MGIKDTRGSYEATTAADCLDAILGVDDVRCII